MTTGNVGSPRPEEGKRETARGRKEGREKATGNARKSKGHKALYLGSHAIRLDPPRRTSVPLTTDEALRCYDGSCFTTTLSERNFRYSSARPPRWIRLSGQSPWSRVRSHGESLSKARSAEKLPWLRTVETATQQRNMHVARFPWFTALCIYSRLRRGISALHPRNRICSLHLTILVNTESIVGIMKKRYQRYRYKLHVKNTMTNVSFAILLCITSNYIVAIIYIFLGIARSSLRRHRDSNKVTL